MRRSDWSAHAESTTVSPEEAKRPLDSGFQRGLTAFVSLRISHGDWDRHQNTCPGTSRFNFQIARELSQPFAHATDADAGTSRLDFGQFLLRYPVPLVL